MRLMSKVNTAILSSRNLHSKYPGSILTTLTLLVLMTSCLLTACSSKQTIVTPSPSRNSIRVATYNVNWGNDQWKNHKPLNTVNAIAKLNADIVLLQEVTPPWEKLIRQNLSGQYKHQSYKHYKEASGLAVLSKYPFHSVKFIKPNGGWHPTWIVQAQTKLGSVQLVNVHLSPSLVDHKNIGVLGQGLIIGPKKRRQEIQELLPQIPKRSKTIIAGDFNENGTGAVASHLQSHHYTNAFTESKKKQHTWSWRVGLFELRNSFDQIYYTHDLKAVNVQVLHEGSSDHYPVAVDLVRRGSQ